MNESHTIPRAIEIGFPIVEINRLAVPERNAFKPIYQMHKWFARRASCVFRAILLGSLKPAFQTDGTPTDLMAEFYKDHTDDPDTKGKHILDPFMGGGTTVVEALRLGCTITGIDINPVSWFIVKTEVEPVDLDELQQAFERLAARPVEWNDNRPLRETLLGLYKTGVEPGLEADVIYTFWVKHAICTDPNCRREVPLFSDYIIAQKSPSVRYFRDVMCPHCGQTYDWDTENVSLIIDPAMTVNAPRGSSGTGRPVSKWSYAPLNPKQNSIPMVDCPHCHKLGIPKLKGQEIERKKVPYTVLLCPACEAVWQWRGNVPEGDMECPACGNAYDPYKGNVPQKGKFTCPYCGNRDKIIESIRRLPQDRHLPIRPYAIQAYLPAEAFYDDDVGQKQDKLFQMNHDQGQARPISNAQLTNEKRNEFIQRLPKNGKFFMRFSVSDKARLQQAERLWKEHKSRLPFPKSKIPRGAETGRLLEYHHNYWHEMFLPRQLLALSTLFKGILAEQDESLQEMLLCAFSDCVARNNLFCRYFNDRNTIQEIFSRHDYQPKSTIAEGSVYGDERIRGTYPQMFGRLIEGKAFNEKAFDWYYDPSGKRKEGYKDIRVDGANAALNCGNSSNRLPANSGNSKCVITDPPYVGNVNYAELSDFFYVWLRLVLKDRYTHFAPEYTPKADEIIENRTRGKTIQDFYNDLAKVFSRIHEAFPDDGLLVFTFHHTDQEGTVWEGLLQALCETGFEIVAVYPIHGESESSLHLMDKENVSYDLIHVCRKRRSDTRQRSWAGIRQEVRQLARAELKAIQEGRYGKEPLLPPDVRLICIGKCLQLYSAHYRQVVDHNGDPLPLRFALQDIGTIVDQLVTKDRPLPPELEDADPISYAWLRVLLQIRREVKVDEVNKALRAMQITPDELKKTGLIIHGRTGRGRTYEVKQPNERLNTLLEKLKGPKIPGGIQTSLFDEVGDPIIRAVSLVDLVHLLIGLADGGESVAPWLERFSRQQPKVRAALRFIREARPDWEGPISHILPLVDETSFFKHVEEN